MTNDRKRSDESVISSSDLKYILDVNQKAVEIYVEVEQQNDQIIKTLDQFKSINIVFDKKLDNIEDLLEDDNAHDHNLIIESLKSLSVDIKTLGVEIKELQLSESKIKDAMDAAHKLIEADIKSKISEIDKNLLRLTIILGTTGIGTIFTVIQSFLHK